MDQHQLPCAGAQWLCYQGSRVGGVIAHRSHHPGLALIPVLLPQGCCQHRDPMDDVLLTSAPEHLSLNPGQAPAAHQHLGAPRDHSWSRDCLETRSSCREERARWGRPSPITPGGAGEDSCRFPKQPLAAPGSNPTGEPGTWGARDLELSQAAPAHQPQAQNPDCRPRLRLASTGMTWRSSYCGRAPQEVTILHNGIPMG